MNEYMPVDMPSTPIEWFVLCLDDEGVYTLSEMETYPTREDAEAMMALIAPIRCPMVAYIDVTRAMRPSHERGHNHA